MLLFFRHNDLPWNIRRFAHNNLDRFNLSYNVKYIEPWSKSPWSHTDIQRMRQGLLGCQVCDETNLILDFVRCYSDTNEI